MLNRELIALFIEGDLPGGQERQVRLHVEVCADCLQFCRQIEQSQSLLKGARRRTVNPAALHEVRRSVLSRIESPGQALGWKVRIERFFLLACRTPRYAAAGLGMLAVVSATLLGTMVKPPVKAVGPAAVFAGNDRLLRPDGYGEWVLVGVSPDSDISPHSGEPGGSPASANVYIDPSAYMRYTQTGAFPEGTVLVLETAIRWTGEGASGLAVSVKDSSRFDSGWGYFAFPGGGGTPKANPQAALPQENRCRSCHETQAETDHVFTQYYPALKAAGARS
jgi:hypothetical protein